MRYVSLQEHKKSMRFNFFSFLLSWMLFLSLQLHAQKQDLTITIKEPIVNKIFSALGDIKGTAPYSFIFMEGTYTWQKNPSPSPPNKISFNFTIRSFP